MKNLEIKKIIQNATKGINNFRVEVILWHGQTTEIDNAIYNEVVLYNERSNNIIECDSMYFGSELEDNEENIKILKKEQKKVFNYLCKIFTNVNIAMKETNV